MTGEIVIVGAGIIGLTVAYELSLHTSHPIVIIASEFPDDDALSPSYTSTRAGAHFRPFPSLTKSDEREQKYTRVTLSRFKKLSKLEPQSSIKFIQGEEYFQDPSREISTLSKGYTEGLENFEVIPKSELPKTIKFGTRYKTWSCNPPVLLSFYMNKLTNCDKVTVLRKKLNALCEVETLYPNFFRIINCTGLGLQYTGGYDPQCFKIRGQTLLLGNNPNSVYNNKTITIQMANNKWCFVIPRPLNGGIILGGTKTINNTETTPLQEETASLIKNGELFFPDLMVQNPVSTGFEQKKKNDDDDVKIFDIKKINVGFRPARKNGSLVGIDNKYPKVINAYGVAGMGFEVSFGIAEEVNRLISISDYRSSKL